MAKHTTTVGRRKQAAEVVLNDEEVRAEDDEQGEAVLMKREDAEVGDVENNSPEGRKVVISLDTPLPDVLSFNKDDGVVMLFDHHSFLELPDSVVKDLRYENRNNYFMARGAKMAAKTAPVRKKRKLIDPLTDALTIRLEAIEDKHQNKAERRWFHQAWIDPKFVDRFKGQGYRNVRQNKDGVDDPSGEIVKLMNGDSVELVALEIPWPVYEDHLHALSEKSRNSYSASKERVKDDVQRSYGLNVYDEEDENERDYMNYLVGKSNNAGD